MNSTISIRRFEKKQAISSRELSELGTKAKEIALKTAKAHSKWSKSKGKFAELKKTLKTLSDPTKGIQSSKLSAKFLLAKLKDNKKEVTASEAQLKEMELQLEEAIHQLKSGKAKHDQVSRLVIKKKKLTQELKEESLIDEMVALKSIEQKNSHKVKSAEIFEIVDRFETIENSEISTIDENTTRESTFESLKQTESAHTSNFLTGSESQQEQSKQYLQELPEKQEQLSENQKKEKFQLSEEVRQGIQNLHSSSELGNEAVTMNIKSQKGENLEVTVKKTSGQRYIIEITAFEPSAQVSLWRERTHMLQNFKELGMKNVSIKIKGGTHEQRSTFRSSS